MRWIIRVNIHFIRYFESSTEFRRFHNNLKNFSKDPKSDELPLVRNPYLVIGIIFAYLYIVLQFGPRFMEKRAPFQIKNILIVYNAFQIVANLVVWIYVSRLGSSKQVSKRFSS